VSIESIALALHHSRSKGTAKLVLIGIANHDGDGGAWPSVATLSKYGACDARQVQRAIKQLEELGEVRRHVGAGGNERTRKDRRPNRYDILIRCPASCDGSKEHRERGDTGDTSLPNGVTSKASRGDIHGSHGVVEMSPEPSLEPSIEPLAAEPRKREPDLLFEALAKAGGHDLTKLTANERGRINKAAKQLREIEATPDQVEAAAKAYKVKYPEVACTPLALVSNWTTLQPAKRRKGYQDTVWCPICGEDSEGPNHEELCDAYARYN